MHSLADAERAFQALLNYVLSHHLDGVPLAEIPWVRQLLADLSAELRGAVILSWRLTADTARGRDVTKLAAMVKVASSEVQERVLSAAMDIIGPESVLESWGADDPGVPLRGLLPELYRTTRVWFIAGGANEVKRNIIAQRGLGMPRD